MDRDFLLIRKMKSGDEYAMEIFVRKYYSKILQYCRYHSINRGLAEDLTQETFVKFFAALATYQHVGKAINYLYVIAKNLCIDFQKKNMEIVTENIPESEENQADNIENRLDIERALEMLSEEMREVIILHYFQDFSLREAAEILSIGLPLTKYRIKKAKERLRTLLGKEESP